MEKGNEKCEPPTADTDVRGPYSTNKGIVSLKTHTFRAIFTINVKKNGFASNVMAKTKQRTAQWINTLLFPISLSGNLQIIDVDTSIQSLNECIQALQH